MFIVSFYFFIVLQVLLINTEKENCHDILCAKIIDPVCGMITYPTGTTVIRKYQNICLLRAEKCRLKNKGYVLHKIPDKICGIKKEYSGRRGYDYSIVGAHQACNHTCPTYCVDTYEPACAQIWKPNMQDFNYRPMVNHCHIDLLSCALAVNVTIHPLGKCFKNSAGLMFMAQVAALKSLGLIGEANEPPRHIKNMKAIEIG